MHGRAAERGRTRVRNPLTWRMDRFRGLPRESVLGFEVPVATTFASRLLGLALLPRERAPAGLLIPRCRSVHTVAMRFPLDLLFFDRDLLVIELWRDVGPWRIVHCPEAAAVLELPAPIIPG